eukprot:764311-Hanusia_phi.AAC.2
MASKTRQKRPGTITQKSETNKCEVSGTISPHAPYVDVLSWNLDGLGEGMRPRERAGLALEEIFDNSKDGRPLPDVLCFQVERDIDIDIDIDIDKDIDKDSDRDREREGDGSWNGYVDLEKDRIPAGREIPGSYFTKIYLRQAGRTTTIQSFRKDYPTSMQVVYPAKLSSLDEVRAREETICRQTYSHNASGEPGSIEAHLLLRLSLMLVCSDLQAPNWQVREEQLQHAVNHLESVKGKEPCAKEAMASSRMTIAAQTDTPPDLGSLALLLTPSDTILCPHGMQPGTSTSAACWGSKPLEGLAAGLIAASSARGGKQLGAEDAL